MGEEVAAHHHAGKIRLDHQTAAERLHHHHGLDSATAVTPIFLRQRGPQPAKLCHLGPIVLAVPFGGGDQCAPFIEFVLLADETVDAILEQLLFFAE